MNIELLSTIMSKSFFFIARNDNNKK